LPTGFMKVRDSRFPLAHRSGVAGGGQGEGRAGPRVRPHRPGRGPAALAATRLPGLRGAIALPHARLSSATAPEGRTARRAAASGHRVGAPPTGQGTGHSAR
jgi:hypothetical protein